MMTIQLILLVFSIFSISQVNCSALGVNTNNLTNSLNGILSVDDGATGTLLSFLGGKQDNKQVTGDMDTETENQQEPSCMDREACIAFCKESFLEDKMVQNKCMKACSAKSSTGKDGESTTMESNETETASLETGTDLE